MDLPPPEIKWHQKSTRPLPGPKNLSLEVYARVDARHILQGMQDYTSQLTLDGSKHSNEEIFKQTIFPTDWTNRLILGDAFSVMQVLTERERLKGAVQMIYMDPPYGIGLSSSFKKRVKAYRDVWQDGIHSYLSYLRERFAACRELLAPTGSIFVQINAEKVHYVRILLDEVFGSENYIALIPYRSGTSQRAKHIGSVYDYLVWFARDKAQMKYHRLFLERDFQQRTSTFDWVELPDGAFRKLTSDEKANPKLLPGGKLVKLAQLKFKKPEQIQNLRAAGRIHSLNGKEYGKRYEEDFPFVPLLNVWTDTVKSTFASNKQYVVETSPKVIERCILMTTDPGDLVLDPTAGSGITAYLAEKWTRRWITIDISRIAIMLARNKVVSGVFPRYKGAGADENSPGTQNETAKHVTLGTIANEKTPKQDVLYDRPLKEKRQFRVASPFVMEWLRVPAEGFTPSGSGGVHEIRPLLIDFLRECGIVFPGHKLLDFLSMEKSSGGAFHARGKVSLASGIEKIVGIYINNPLTPLDSITIQDVIKEVVSVNLDALFFVSEYFHNGVTDVSQYSNQEDLVVDFIYLNPDFHMHEYLKITPNTVMFSGSVRPVFKNPSAGKNQRFSISAEVSRIEAFDPEAWAFQEVPASSLHAWAVGTVDKDGCYLPLQIARLGRKNLWGRASRRFKNFLSEEKVRASTGLVAYPLRAKKGDQKFMETMDVRGNRFLRRIP